MVKSIFVLIIFGISGGSGVDMTHVFYTEKACVEAAAQVNKNMIIRAFCVRDEVRE
jgi:hypothetical protein